MLPQTTSIWQHDSLPKASGKTGAVHYELVEKAVLSGCSTLVTISAATDLAIERARSCGLTLMPLSRPDAILRVATT